MDKLLGAVVLVILSVPVYAQQTIRPDGAGGYVIENQGACGGLWGFAKGQCIARQQRLEQQQQVLQQQQEIRDQQHEQSQERIQQQIQEQQLENEKLKNEILRQQLMTQGPSATQRVPTPDQPLASNSVVFQRWLADNPWFESDRPKRELALLYAKQLRQERPDLTGREFLDAVSAKVKQVFAGAR